jgi:hypothetical protein
MQVYHIPAEPQYNLDSWTQQIIWSNLPPWRPIYAHLPTQLMYPMKAESLVAVLVTLHAIALLLLQILLPQSWHPLCGCSHEMSSVLEMVPIAPWLVPCFAHYGSDSESCLGRAASICPFPDPCILTFADTRLQSVFLFHWPSWFQRAGVADLSRVQYMANWPKDQEMKFRASMTYVEDITHFIKTLRDDSLKIRKSYGNRYVWKLTSENGGAEMEVSSLNE